MNCALKTKQLKSIAQHGQPKMSAPLLFRKHFGRVPDTVGVKNSNKKSIPPAEKQEKRPVPEEEYAAA
jgi:hypothetical protein